MAKDKYRSSVDDIPKYVEPFRSFGLFSRDYMAKTLRHLRKLQDEVISLDLFCDMFQDPESYPYIQSALHHNRLLIDRIRKTLECPY